MAQNQPPVKNNGPFDVRALLKQLLVLVVSLAMALSGSPIEALAQAYTESLAREAVEQALNERQGEAYAISYDANADDATGTMDSLLFGEELAEAVLDEDGNVVTPAEEPDPDAYKVTVPEATFVREGYRFTGWNTTHDGNDIIGTETYTDDDGNEQTYPVVKIAAQEVPAGAELDRFVFAYDVDDDGVVRDDETADIYNCLQDGVLTLYAQWEEVPSDSDPATTDLAATEDKQFVTDSTGTPVADAAENDPDTVATPTVSEEADTAVGSQTYADTEVLSAVGITNEDLTSSTIVLGTEAAEEMAQASQMVTVSSLRAALSPTVAAVPMPLLADDDLLEADGTSIVDFNVEWVTVCNSDTCDHDHSADQVVPELLWDATSSTASFQLRVNMTFSGQHDYEPDSICITVPKDLFVDADGNALGTMTCGLPDYPSTTASFAVIDMGDYFLIKNTRTIAAASSHYFEFSIRNVNLTKMVNADTERKDPESGDVSNDFSAELTLTTYAGTELKATSDPIYCVVTRSTELRQPSKSGKYYFGDSSSLPSSIKALAQSRGLSVEDYVFVDWKVTGSASGNRAYSLAFEDDPSCGGAYRCTVLSTTGSGFERHVYVAYPLSQFEPGVSTTVTNTGTYTLREAYDTLGEPTEYGEEQAGSATGYVTFTPYKWTAPSRDDLNLSKNGMGAYGYALDRLVAADATDVECTFKVSVTDERALLTAGYYTTPDLDTVDQSTLGQRDVHTWIWDDAVGLASVISGDVDLEDADYDVTSLTIARPIVYDWQKNTATQSNAWVPTTDDYLVYSDELRLDVSVQTTVGGDWVTVGTLVYDKAGNHSFEPAEGYDGLVWVTWDGTTAVLTFHESLHAKSWRLDTWNKELKLGFSVTAGFRFHPTEHLQSVVNAILESDEGYGVESLTVVNKAYANHWIDGDIEVPSAIDDDAENNLEHVNSRVRLTKSCTKTTDNKAAQQVELSFTSTVTQQSNLHSEEEYLNAIRLGHLTPFKTGRFYDLLPLGVEYVEGSVKLSSATATGVSDVEVVTYENWRGSGRTMLIVTFRHDVDPVYYQQIYADSTATGGDLENTAFGEKVTLTFKATMTYDALASVGEVTESGGSIITKVSQTNNIAFGSIDQTEGFGTAVQWTGTPNDPEDVTEVADVETLPTHCEAVEAVQGAESGIGNLMANLGLPNDEGEVVPDTGQFVYAKSKQTVQVKTATNRAWVAKTGKAYTNNSTQSASIDYTVTAYQKSDQEDLSNYQTSVRVGELTPLKNVRIFDLLPNGMEIDEGSLSAGDDKIVNVRQILNWQGSGRTMVVVDILHTANPTLIKVKPGTASGSDTGTYGEVVTLTYTATISYKMLKDYGYDQTNLVAAESIDAPYGNATGWTAGPNDPLRDVRGVLTGEDAELMSNLTTTAGGTPDDGLFIYGKATVTVSVDEWGTVGMDKQVISCTGTEYTDALSDEEPTVPVGGVYTYRLRFRNDPRSESRHIVIYDALESYLPDGVEDSWHGTLLSLDLSQLEKMGVKATVYYSGSLEAAQQLREAGDGAYPDLTAKDSQGNDLWTTTRPEGTVAAIAIDCSKASDGVTDYVLQPGETLSVFVSMRAPESSEETSRYVAEDIKAYNDVYSSVTMTRGNTENRRYSHNYYTEMGLVPMDVTVSKTWDDDDDRDGLRPSVVLVGLTANGAPYPSAESQMTAELSADNDWSATFEGVSWGDANGQPFSYSVEELAYDGSASSGYTATVEQGSGSTQLHVKLSLTNTHEPERVAVSGDKTWAGDEPIDESGAVSSRPASIQVTLYADDVAVKTVTVTPDEDGSWSYDFGEQLKYRDQGQEIVYTVQEQDVENYYADYAALESEEDGYVLSVTNTYRPFGDVSLTKVVENATPEALKARFEFRVEVEDSGGAAVEGTYGYTITSKDGTTSGGMTTFPTTVTLAAGDTLQLHDLPAGSTYRFTETDVDGFNQTRIDKTEGIVRSSAPTVARVAATYVNTYTTKGSINLRATKSLVGRDLAAYLFNFTVQERVVGEDGSVGYVQVRSGTNERGSEREADEEASTANVIFGALNYDLNDIDRETGTGMHVYRISEVDSGRNGYAYDPTVYEVEVALQDNGDGTLTCTPTYYEVTDGERGDALPKGELPSFSNVYVATGQIDLTAQKFQTGRDLAGGDHTFQLIESDEDGSLRTNDDGSLRVVWQGTNAADGTIHIELPFGQNADVRDAATGKAGEDGANEYDSGRTYYYMLREAKPGDLDPDATDDPSMVYDEQQQLVVVNVKDQGKGVLVCETTFETEEGKSPLVFQNQVTSSLTIRKLVEELTEEQEDEEFTFKVTIRDPSGNPLSGEYDYEIKEVETSEPSGDEEIEGEPTVQTAAPAAASTATTYAATDQSVDAPVFVWGVDDKPETDDIARGTWGDEVSWRIASDGTMYFWPTNGVSGSGYSLDALNSKPWDNYKSSILRIVSADGVKAPERLFGLFAYCSNLRDISGLSKWDVSAVNHMWSIFLDCSSLESVEPIYNWNLSGDVYTQTMFNGCSSLKEIDLSKWHITSTSVIGTFANCSSLEYVDISGFVITSVTLMVWNNDVTKTAHTFESSNSLVQVRLPESFYTYATVATPDLPTPSGSLYTGRWVKVDGTPSGALTPTEIRTGWSDGWGGLWVAELKAGPLVHFDANGGSGQMEDADLTATTSNVVNMSEHPNLFVRPNYRFVGWNTAADGSGLSLPAEGPAAFPIAEAGQEITLYAQWEKQPAAPGEDGSFRVTLRPNEELTITGLPAGATYTVEELSKAGWALVDSSGTTGLIEDGKTPVASFTNEAGKASVSLSVEKLVDGVTPSSDDETYWFTLEDETGKLIEKVSNTGSFVQFSSLVYKPEDAGLHTYVIKEVKGTTEGMQYDNHEVNVSVQVDTTDDDLTATVDYGDSDRTFRNSYEEQYQYGTVVIAKEALGQDGYQLLGAVADQGFTFDLVGRDRAGAPLNGTYEYSLSGEKGSEEPESPRVEFVDGKATLTLHVGESATFTSLPIGATVQVTETALAGWTPELLSDDAVLNVERGKTDEARFRNTYSPIASLSVTAVKDLVGGELQTGQFTFELHRSTRASVDHPWVLDEDFKATAHNTADGSVNFSAVSLSASDLAAIQSGSVKYFLTEVVPDDPDQDISYDRDEHPLALQLTDNGDGTVSVFAASAGADGNMLEEEGVPATPTFTNTVTGKLAITKTVTNETEALAAKNRRYSFRVTLHDADGQLLTDELTYDLLDADGNVVSENRKSDGSVVQVGSGETALVYVAPGGTYEVEEVLGEGEDAYFLRGAVTGESGTVAAGETAACTWENIYQPTGTYAFSATKDFKNGTLTGGDFQFALAYTNSKGRQVVVRAFNDEKGSVQFQTLSFTSDDEGVRKFTISETQPDFPEDDIVYDTTVHECWLQIADDGEGTMVCTLVEPVADEGGAVTYQTATGDTAAMPTFVNVKTIKLPFTGAPGILLGATAGIALIAMCGWQIRRRKNA